MNLNMKLVSIMNLFFIHWELVMLDIKYLYDEIILISRLVYKTLRKIREKRFLLTRIFSFKDIIVNSVFTRENRG